MSFRLEIRGQSVADWPLTSGSLEHIERLRTSDAREGVEALFGSDQTNDGDVRSAARQSLLESVKLLRRSADALPAGFQMRMPPLAPGMQESVGSGGVSGLLIYGLFHCLDCRGDHWTLQSIDDMRAGIEPMPRSDEAEIDTQNRGVYRVERKKSGQSHLSRLLREVQEFLEQDSGESVEIVWG